MPQFDGALPRSFDTDYSADGKLVEQATYDRLQNLMNPSFNERRSRLDNRLAVMGMPVGGEAYGTEKDRFGRLRNEADLNAGLESVVAGRQEQSRLYGIDNAINAQSLARSQSQFNADMVGRNALSNERMQQARLNNANREQSLAERRSAADDRNDNRRQLDSEALQQFNIDQSLRSQGANERLTERSQPFNELSAILQGSPAMNAPTAPNTAQYQMAAPDIAGMINNQYATEAGNQASKKGGITGMAGTLGGAYLGGPGGAMLGNKLFG